MNGKEKISGINLGDMFSIDTIDVIDTPKYLSPNEMKKCYLSESGFLEFRKRKPTDVIEFIAYCFQNYDGNELIRVVVSKFDKDELKPNKLIYDMNENIKKDYNAGKVYFKRR